MYANIGYGRQKGVECIVHATAVTIDMFGRPTRTRPSSSLLKWVGSKYKVAEQIASYIPADVGTYYEAFLGSGSVLATVAPAKAVGADSFAPLVEIWQAVKTNPRLVKAWYEDRWAYAMAGDKRERYEEIKASYNTTANAADFLFLSRSCYAGIVRFRKRDGYMSTPVGAHRPIAPCTFAERVDEWSRRIQGTEFLHADYAEVMDRAVAGDFVYCDPPYSHSQSILYGAQDFDLAHLFSVIASCKSRGVRVALSIDGTKKSGARNCEISMPDRLFEQVVSIDLGRSMLRRLQMNGQTLESERVADRLMLTY